MQAVKGASSKQRPGKRPFAPKRPLPDELAGLFHNYEPASIDLDRHADLVIRTVLAGGTWEQVLWLFREYGWDPVRQVVLADHLGLRALPEPTRRLWLAVFSQAPDTQAADDGGHDPLERWRCRRIPGGPRVRSGNRAAPRT